MADSQGGIPPRMPRKPVLGSIVAGLRPLRQHLRETIEAIDRGRQQSQPDTARELVQVINGGHMGTSPDLVYWTNPVQIDADDVEGATPTFSSDTSQTIPVVFVGDAPSAGDYAVAHAIAGRWCSDHGTPQQECGCTSCFGVPNADLTLTFDPPWGIQGGTVSATTLKANGPSALSWTACFGAIPGNPGGPNLPNTPECTFFGACFNWVFQLSCPSFAAAPTFSYGLPHAESGCIVPPPGDNNADFGSGPVTPISFTASPFKAVYRPGPGKNDSNTTFTITGPDLGSNPKYCVKICVSGCICGPLAGATVAITDSNGNPVASGTTTASGCVTLDIKKKGTYTVTVTADGWTTYTKTMLLTCTRVGVGLLYKGPFFLTQFTAPGCPQGPMAMTPSADYSQWTVTYGTGDPGFPNTCPCVTFTYACGLNSSLTGIFCDGTGAGTLAPTTIDCQNKVITYQIGNLTAFQITWQ